MSRSFAPLLCVCLLALGCQSPVVPASPAAVVPGETAPPPPEPPALLEPPAAGVAADAPFPPIVHQRLENGFAVRAVERHVQPLVHVSLVVRSGSATDGEKPGLAQLTSELAKAGGAGGLSPRKLAERAEALGATLEVSADRDSTRLSLGVLSADFEDAVEVLSLVALSPALPEGELAKLKVREADRRRSYARGNATWSAAMVLYRELYDLPAAVHPYSRYDASADDLQKLTLADCRAWYAAHFVPSNASLVVVGDVEVDRVARAATKAFGAWKGGEAPTPDFAKPMPPSSRQLYLVDRPGSAQAQVLVGVLGPERRSPEWPALAAANQVLGGGVSGRLFLDVREKRSLAYSTGASLGEVASGAVPIVLSAGTQTAKAVEAVSVLLEHLEQIASRAPTEAELARATRFLADSFVLRLETVGSIAELVTQLYVLGLPDDYYDQYRADLRELAVARVSAASTRHYRATPIVVVSGDAATIGPALAELGPVAVLDPERGFGLKRSYPQK